MLERPEGRRRGGRQRMRWLDANHQFNGHGFGLTLGVGDGQGGLTFCGSWVCKESDTTKLLKRTEADSITFKRKDTHILTTLKERKTFYKLQFILLCKI